MKVNMLFFLFFFLCYASEVKCQNFNFWIIGKIDVSYDNLTQKSITSDYREIMGTLEIYSDRIVIFESGNGTITYSIQKFNGIEENNEKYVERVWWCSANPNQKPDDYVDKENLVKIYLFAFKTKNEITVRVDPWNGNGILYALQRRK